MALSLEQGKETLINTIRYDKRHRDYQRVCEIADMYSTFITGEDVGKLLVQFQPRETDEQFAQRLRITEVITPYIAARIMAPMYKVGRTLASKQLSWPNKDDNDDKVKSLQDAMDNYAGDEPLEDYLTHCLVDMDSMDPNSWIVTDFEGRVNPNDLNSRAEPYPFEVNSHEAIDYVKKNNRTQYLTVLINTNGLERYTMYLDNDAIIAQQITEEQYNSLEPGFEILFKDPEKKEKDNIYVISVATHKAGKIPAIQVGCKKDPKTRKRTYVPLIHGARAFFRKSIKTISEFDLTNSLHIFPKVFMYDNVCPGDMDNQVLCNQGKTPGGDTCHVCKGSGFNEHHSSSDIVRVKLPHDLKDIVSLDNMLAYKTPPIELIEFMKKLGLYELPDLATKAVYCSEMFTSDSIVSTATEKNIDLESVYDTLKPFANKWSAVYKHIVSVIAEYIDLGKELTVTHTFPKDFKMKTMTSLLEDLGKANTGGAPSYIKKEINRDIAQKLYTDKPDELMKISVKEKFFPFNGKSENEINSILNNNLTTQYNKILYANFDTIFDELEQENSSDDISFWKIETSLQRDLLKTKVGEYILSIETDNAGQRAVPFRVPSDVPAEGTQEEGVEGEN